MAEPLVLLPESMCDARLYWPQVAELSHEMAVMVAPVHLGDRIEEIASGLLDVLPRRFALAGCGFGGMVAIELQRRAPDRVARLMLIGSSPLADTPQQATDRDRLVIKARAGRFDEALAGLIPEESFADRPFRPEIIALVREMGQSFGPDIFVRQARALQRRRDQQAVMVKLRIPVMIAAGSQDTLYPEKRQSVLAELVPGAVLRMLPGAGHLPMLEDPDGLCTAIRDWMRLPAAR
ncbi:alpha/beta fold hydrolase [Salipiger mangrovisoli]|uniref:Alpha/beta fold hydrolase n=1 Tax=Salipiger mangrovisoli TaxID=2865933 RepID=A0ABR9X881_9RHOB|nr:alpha/beta fold hydrolase [Salipiger mangrovisoli]MBE9639748.1 alpha/beta fold hydrolase [Salipiger mangrovisoli]